ncbi:MAG TPA: YciI family protein [Streptosporangiaceae bacterium]|nr:YciI family protein [Streptosporangiaceae bacterium]
MKQYLLSVYQPEGTPPSPEVLEKIMRDVGAVREQMQAAGAWVFSGGLNAPDTATVLRSDGGEMLMTDGPFAEGKEYLGGFTIIRAADLDAALEWGRRLARVLPLPIEVRPFVDEAGD